MKAGVEARATDVAKFERHSLARFRNSLNRDGIAVRDFNLSERTETDKKALLDACSDSRRALASAHFVLGINAIADGKRDEAEDNLRKCYEVGEFFFYVVQFSAALLEELNDDRAWPNWIPDNGPEGKMQSQ